MLKFEEVGRDYVVSGPYEEIKSVISFLKRYRFSYNPTYRHWVIPLSALTLENRKKIDNYLGKFQASLEKKEQGVRIVLEQIKSYNWSTYSVRDLGRSGFYVKGTVKGATYNLSNYFNHAGWKWVSDSYVYVSGGKSENESLFKAMVQFDEQYKVSLKVQVQQPYKSQPSVRCISNRRPDECIYCGQMVDAGQGCMAEFDSSRLPGPNVTRSALNKAMNADDERPVWLVWHRDKKICDKLKLEAEEDAKLRREFARNRNRALKVIREWAKRKGQRPSGQNRLSGRQVMLDSKGIMYGGGEWVVISPDERTFWYVQNNGSDGADWSLNNVVTGGAGAIGWKARLNPKLLKIIEFAKEK